MSQETKKKFTVIAVLLGAAALVAILISLPQGSSVDSGKADEILRGVPQEGTLLGEKDAPFTLLEFADLQCPYCAQFAEEGLPLLLQGPVKEGKLKIDLRPLALLGPDSGKAARAALTASKQNRMWQFTETYYLNQKPGESVSDEFIQEIQEASGVSEAQAEADSEFAEEKLAKDDELAFRLGVSSTPSFFLRDKSGRIERVVFNDFSEEEILSALQKAGLK